MINIDFLTMRAFLLENIDFLISSRLQKIQQPTRREFIFFLRNNGESRKLYVNIYPNIYHLAFMSGKNEKRRNIVIPQKPPMFCMLLRKYIEGAKIIDALTIEGERILELHFETYDELSQKRQLCLCFELMGKHSNVILYDRETMIIIGCAHNVGSEKSRFRELQGGLKYIYPPVTTSSLGGGGGERVSLSNELKLQLKDLPQEKIEDYLKSEEFRPAILDNRYTLFKELIPNSEPQNSVNEMLDNYYSKIQEQVNIQSEKTKLSEIANSKLKKVKNSIAKISALLKKRDNTDKYKLYGELLTANLYKKLDYQKEIEVYDYINGSNIKIELDKTKTLSENAQRYYKLYTKSKTTQEKSKEMLENLNVEKEYLENILYSVETAKNLIQLEEIKSEFGVENQKQKQATKTMVEKINIKGFDVYIGKNNKQNDYIISKLAKDDDIWFHTRTCAGSHILLKVEDKEPDDATIFECCKLARKFSSAKEPSKVGVIYTKKKYLRKPPAAPLGYVTYKNEKEVLI